MTPDPAAGERASALPAVGPDGGLHIDAFELPPATAWSEAARRIFLRRFASPPLRDPIDTGDPEGDWLANARSFRSNMEQLHRVLLARIEDDHPCLVVDDEVGGVPVRWVTPASGVVHDDRVLLDLHGGAFVGGAEHCGLVESFPIASTAGYRVGVVDYRQGWEHRFPAASEDVASVHRALLDRYAPDQIGIFGYSAGGMLTAQVTAWLLDHGDPRPGAIAICSAGAGGGSDSWYLGNVAMGAPPVGPYDDGRVALGAHVEPAPHGYAAGVDPTDPLFAPIHSPELLAQFPPTLLLTGSRSFDLSSSLLCHRALHRAGVVTELHAWEGMWHCFPYNHRLPEAQDAFSTLTRFFDRYLGGR